MFVSFLFFKRNILRLHFAQTTKEQECVFSKRKLTDAHSAYVATKEPSSFAKPSSSKIHLRISRFASRPFSLRAGRAISLCNRHNESNADKWGNRPERTRSRIVRHGRSPSALWLCSLRDPLFVGIKIKRLTVSGDNCRQNLKIFKLIYILI